MSRKHPTFSRFSHILTLSICLLMIHAWFCVAQPVVGAKPNVPVVLKNDDAARMQAIAESFNTHWRTRDPAHCRHICITSRRACKLRGCVGVPGAKQWD